MGWLAVASAAGLALSRISWTSYIWLPPYVMFWLWVVMVAMVLLRRNFRGSLNPVRSCAGGIRPRSAAEHSAGRQSHLTCLALQGWAW